MTNQGGAGGMREPSGVGGLTGSGGDEGAGSHGGATGSQDRGGVWASKAESRDRPDSTPTELEIVRPAASPRQRW